MSATADNYIRKLTAAQVADLRKRYSRGEKQTALAALYSLSQSSVSRIVRRLSWRAFV